MPFESPISSVPLPPFVQCLPWKNLYSRIFEPQWGASSRWVGVRMDVGKLLGARIVLVPYELLDQLWGFQSSPILTSIVKSVKKCLNWIWTLQLVQICMGAMWQTGVFCGGSIRCVVRFSRSVGIDLWWLVAVVFCFCHEICVKSLDWTSAIQALAPLKRPETHCEQLTA